MKLKFSPSALPEIILGAIYAMGGLAGLLNLAPPPKDLPADMMTFMTGMMAAKYFFPLLKLTELVAGLLLVVRQAPALALIILAPITINIIFVHAFLTPGIENLLLPFGLLGLQIFSMKRYSELYFGLLKKI